MKKIILFILIMLIIIFGIYNKQQTIEEEETTYVINGTEKIVNGYEDIEGEFVSRIYKIGYNSILLLDTKDMTQDILENRKGNGVLIIERVIGIVDDDKEGDGIILNTSDKDHNYISYRNVNFETRNGTIILSYFVYNPNTNYVDDVVRRYDFVLDREYED